MCNRWQRKREKPILPIHLIMNVWRMATIEYELTHTQRKRMRAAPQGMKRENHRVGRNVHSLNERQTTSRRRKSVSHSKPYDNDHKWHWNFAIAIFLNGTNNVYQSINNNNMSGPVEFFHWPPPSNYLIQFEAHSLSIRTRMPIEWISNYQDRSFFCLLASIPIFCRSTRWQ